jgi:hypothetical protein
MGGVTVPSKKQKPSFYIDEDVADFYYSKEPGRRSALVNAALRLLMQSEAQGTSGSMEERINSLERKVAQLQELSQALKKPTKRAR